MSASSLLDPCVALRRAHPHAAVVAFVPQQQVGRALETALARHTPAGALGWTATTPKAYAKTCSRFARATAARTPLPSAGHRFFIEQVLADVQDDPAVASLPGTQRFGRILAQSIQTLRLNAVDPDAVEARAAAQGGTLAAVAAGYRAYIDRLADAGLYDTADVFQWATAHIRDHGVPEGTVFAVSDSVELADWPFRFLAALRDTGAPFYRIGAASSSLDPPPAFAAARFADVPRPPSEDPLPGANGAPASSTHFRKTIGTTNEVRGVLREILDAGLPLDTVEIAYTSSTPYLPLLADEAERLGVPMTLGPGAPANTSRAGQRLRGIYDWITEEYDPAVLVPLLRSGHLRLDRWAPDGEAPGANADANADADADAPNDDRPVSASALASTLAAQRYAPGRAGVRKALNAALGEVERDMEKRADTTRLEARRARLREAKAFVESLLTWFAPGDEAHPDDGVPNPTMRVQEMAAASLRVLDRLGDDVADGTVSHDDPLDRTAHKVLREKLRKLANLPPEAFAYSAPVSRMARLFREILCADYVGAQQPLPGHVHVLPLRSVGFNGRPNLFVVGMDSATVSASPVDDPLLRDDDLAGLTDVLADVPADAEAGRVQTHADAQLWEMETALDRHNGPTTLYRCAFDLAAAEERFPASLVLRRQRQATRATASLSGEPLVGFAPRANGLTLDDATAWLVQRVHSDANGRASTEEPSARDALHAAFPHLRHGEHATAQRASDTYTAYDGRLASGPFPELDFREADAYTGRILSANRLERFAESPYAYFLMDVLGVRALDEPALDDDPWLSPLRRGSILHKTFEMFWEALLDAGKTPHPDDRDRLGTTFEQVFGEVADRHPPPSDVVEDAARRQLRADVDLFFRVECADAGTFTPVVLEWSVGMPSHRRETRETQPDDGRSDFRLDLHNGVSLPFRGKVDRIDRHRDGSFAVWDYKSGAQRFEPAEPLDGGSTLQWALYAYAVEQANSLPEASKGGVSRAGYYYATVREMGVRLHANPTAYRAEVAALVDALGEAARTGDFGMGPKAKDAAAWKFGGLGRICPDLRARKKQLQAKE